MKKSEQIAINEKVKTMCSVFANTLATTGTGTGESRRLRTCSATVYKVGDFWALRSFNTTIAIIDTTTDTLYDFLRMVYGYTSTSSQHIAKFNIDYSIAYCGCSHRYTYREV